LVRGQRLDGASGDRVVMERRADMSAAVPKHQQQFRIAI
jgi:hypothetical protein